MKFTIETTYDLPIYRQRTYEAETAEEAFALALADDDWEKSEKDYDTSGPTRITGAWEGEDSAYSRPTVPFPSEPNLTSKAISALLTHINVEIERAREQIAEMEKIGDKVSDIIARYLNDHIASLERVRLIAVDQEAPR